MNEILEITVVPLHEVLTMLSIVVLVLFCMLMISWRQNARIKREFAEKFAKFEAKLDENRAIGLRHTSDQIVKAYNAGILAGQDAN